MLDIVIVDTQKDLNVFKHMFQDQKDNGPPLGCCPPNESSCGESKPAENTGGELLARDFNEWAGESAMLLAFLALRLIFLRRVSNLRNQAVEVTRFRREKGGRQEDFRGNGGRMSLGMA